MIIADPDGALLLFRDSDPGLPGVSWWMTPGGGIDEGESAVEAAIREVHEETGLAVTPADLQGPLARRVVLHGYSDQITVQHEEFYRLVVDRFDVTTAGHTEDEQATLLGSAWLDAAAIADWGLPVWPEQVMTLALATGGAVVDLGIVEESTVPIAHGSAEPDRIMQWRSGSG